MSTVRVAGVDGAPGGWAVALADLDLATATLSAPSVVCHESLDALVADGRVGTVSAIAVDMPIGLLDDHPRRADVEARRALGPRRSSVFPTPIRVTLAATDYADACKRSRAACGKALSKQAFNLLPKIAELDALVTPSDQARIVEAHPELAFARLAGEPLAHAKATEDGRRTRRDLITQLVGGMPPHDGVPELDTLDALANLATARHVACGTERRLGGELDATGKRCEIIW